MVREEWVGVLLRRGFRGAARLIALLFTLLFLLLFVLLFAWWSQWSATLDALLTWRRGVSIRGRWTRCIGRVAHTVQWILYGTVDFIELARNLLHAIRILLSHGSFEAHVKNGSLFVGVLRYESGRRSA